MRRRILLLITDLERGGTPTVVREVAVHLRSSAVQVEVACLGRFGPVAEQIAARGIRVTAFGASFAADLRVLPTLRALIGAHRPDTVLSFLVHANAVAAAASLGVGRSVRFLQSIHTTQARPAWHWAVQRVASCAAERIVVPSRSVARALMARAGVAADKIEIIPNAIDAGPFMAMGRPSFTGAIGFIGRLDPVKRIGDLVLAMAEIPSARLEIVGEGPERPRLEQLIRRLGLSNRVFLRGQVADPRDALARIDILALCSEAEGLPMVLLEAMAAGVPIVATDAPGIRDVVVNDQTALLVAIGKPSALAAGIAALLEDPPLRRRLAVEARRVVEERFSWEGVLPCYRRLLGINP